MNSNSHPRRAAAWFNNKLFDSREMAIYIVIAISLVLLLSFKSLHWNAPLDPEYNGKLLSVWVQELDGTFPEEARKEAGLAIHAIGTNAIPLFVGYLSSREDTKVSRFLKAFKARILGVSSSDSFYLRWRGVAGFEALGKLGNPAIPELKAMLLDKELGHCAGAALGFLEPEKVLPLLVSCLDDPAPETRSAGLIGLSSMGASARSIVPRLINMAQTDSSESVRANASEALGRIGPASVVIPILMEKIENDKSPSVRGSAAYGLSFFPEDAEKIEGVLKKALLDKSPKANTGARIALQKLYESLGQQHDQQ